MQRAEQAPCPGTLGLRLFSGAPPSTTFLPPKTLQRPQVRVSLGH